MSRPTRSLIASVVCCAALGAVGAGIWGATRASPAKPAALEPAGQCRAEQQAAEPALQAARFRLMPGDEAVYAGSGSATRVSEMRLFRDRPPETQTLAANFQIELSALALSRDREGYWRIGHFWQVDFDRETTEQAQWLVPFSTGLEFAGANPDDEAWRRWDAARLVGRPALPAQPRGDIRLGQQWEGPVHLRLSKIVPMRCRVAGQEEMAGRTCLRIDVTPLEDLPCAVEDQVMYEGGPPPEVTLTRFDGHLWVAEDNGWVVRVEHTSSLREESHLGVSESELAMSLMLRRARRLSGPEFESRAAQMGRLENIQRHLRMGFPNYNPVEDADIAASKVAAFRRDYPDTPYTSVLTRIEQRIATQREHGKKQAEAGRTDHEMVGKPAPAFVGLTLDGKRMRPADLRGTPALLIFMNIDKEFCTQSAPELEAFEQQWQPRGVRVVGVAMRGVPARSGEFVEQHGLTFPLLTPTSPPGDMAGRDVAMMYGMWTTLGTVVLDSKGIIRYYRWGFYPRETGQVLSELLGH